MESESGPFLNLAVFCEQVIEDKFGVLSLIRVVDRMTITAQGANVPDKMPPTPLSWFLVLNMKSGKAKGTNTIKIEPELPSGLRKSPIIRSLHFEGDNRGAGLITKVNMVLDEPGIYWFRIYLEDKFITQIPIELIYSRTVMPSIQAQG